MWLDGEVRQKRRRAAGRVAAVYLEAKAEAASADAERVGDVDIAASRLAAARLHQGVRGVG
jgi:hypothetical protein